MNELNRLIALQRTVIEAARLHALLVRKKGARYCSEERPLISKIAEMVDEIISVGLDAFPIENTDETREAVRGLYRDQTVHLRDVPRGALLIALVHSITTLKGCPLNVVRLKNWNSFIDQAALVGMRASRTRRGY